MMISRRPNAGTDKKDEFVKLNPVDSERATDIVCRLLYKGGEPVSEEEITFAKSIKAKMIEFGVPESYTLAI